MAILVTVVSCLGITPSLLQPFSWPFGKGVRSNPIIRILPAKKRVLSHIQVLGPDLPSTQQVFPPNSSKTGGVGMGTLPSKRHFLGEPRCFLFNRPRDPDRYRNHAGGTPTESCKASLRPLSKLGLFRSFWERWSLNVNPRNKNIY